MSINVIDTSNETHQGPPDGTQGNLTACYRSIIDTIAFTFFEAESGIRSKIKSKTRKSRMDRIENLSAKKTKIHIPCPKRSFRLGLIDVVQRLHKLRTYLLTETTLPRIFNSICFIRYSRPRKSALHKLCTNIDQPYLIWAAVLCDVSVLHQKTNDTGTKNPTEKKAWLHFQDDFCRLGVAPKMKSGRPIIYVLNQSRQHIVITLKRCLN